jgi:hypothetical protein
LLLGFSNLLLAFVAGVRAGIVARRMQASSVLSVVDGGFSQTAGALAARIARIPHIIWALDLWEENAYPSFERRMARTLEPRLWRNAATVIVHAQELADYYAAKHRIACEVLAVPIENAARALPRSDHPGPPEVLCAGDLYWAQADAVGRLIRARRRLREPVTLTLLTHRESAAARALDTDRIETGISADDFRTRLAAADVLFLGLSFGTPHEDVIRFATPARYPEYLASGTPMVVHAPPDSHVARHARAHNLAEVVDVPDELALATAIGRALTIDMSDQVERARTIALAHDAATVSEQLARLLSRVARQTPEPDR